MSAVNRCPVCLQRAQPTAHYKIAPHMDSLGRSECIGSGHPYRITIYREERAVNKGTRLACSEFPDHAITVRRVAADRSWCDISIYQPWTGSSWSKRMRLPLNDNWEVVRAA